MADDPLFADFCVPPVSSGLWELEERHPQSATGTVLSKNGRFFWVIYNAWKIPLASSGLFDTAEECGYYLRDALYWFQHGIDATEPKPEVNTWQ